MELDRTKIEYLLKEQWNLYKDTEQYTEVLLMLGESAVITLDYIFKEETEEYQRGLVGARLVESIAALRTWNYFDSILLVDWMYLKERVGNLAESALIVSNRHNLTDLVINSTYVRISSAIAIVENTPLYANFLVSRVHLSNTLGDILKRCNLKYSFVSVADFWMGMGQYTEATSRVGTSCVLSVDINTTFREYRDCIHFNYKISTVALMSRLYKCGKERNVYIYYRIFDDSRLSIEERTVLGNNSKLNLIEHILQLLHICGIAYFEGNDLRGVERGTKLSLSESVNLLGSILGLELDESLLSNEWYERAIIEANAVGKTYEVEDE